MALRVVGFGGTTRPGSSTEKALRYALGACEAAGATTRLFAGPELATLSLFAPESQERSELARRFVDELRAADAVLVASPAYHGGISGLVKNALDYTEDLSEDARPYFSGRAVGIISTGAGWQGIVSTLSALRDVVHALRGWATPLGVALNTTTPVFDDRGLPIDEKAGLALETMAREVMQFAGRALDLAAPQR